MVLTHQAHESPAQLPSLASKENHRDHRRAHRQAGRRAVRCARETSIPALVSHDRSPKTFLYATTRCTIHNDPRLSMIWTTGNTIIMHASSDRPMIHVVALWGRSVFGLSIYRLSSSLRVVRFKSARPNALAAPSSASPSLLPPYTCSTSLPRLNRYSCLAVRPSYPHPQQRRIEACFQPRQPL